METTVLATFAHVGQDDRGEMFDGQVNVEMVTEPGKVARHLVVSTHDLPSAMRPAETVDADDVRTWTFSSSAGAMQFALDALGWLDAVR